MTVTASPAFRINGHAATSSASVSASSSVTATLDSIAGVNTVAWSVVGTDGSVAPGSYTLTPSGSKGETVQWTSGVAGTAGILKATINSGINPQTQQDEPAYTATAKWYVPYNGYQLGAAGELLESDSVYGSTLLLNDAIRGVGDAAKGTDWKQSVKVVPPANLASLASVSTSQDGYTIVANDRVGVLFQTTPSQNGIYVAGTPSGGNVALTRATDFDENAEVTDGATFFVEQGTIWGGTTWQLKVGSAITVGSTSLTFGLIPGTIASTQVQSGSSSKNPTTGTVRIGYNGGVYTRDSALGTNYRLIGSDGVDGLVVGDSNTVNATYNVKTAGAHIWQVNGATTAALGSAALSLSTASTVAWADTVSAPSILQATKTSDAAPQNLAITPQAPFASATGANRTAGSLLIELANPTNGGTGLPITKVRYGGTQYIGFGRYDSATAHGGYWAGTAAPTQQNFAFLGDGSSITYLNVPTGGQIELSFNGTSGTGLTVKAATIDVVPATVQWATATAAPKIKQLDLTTNSGTGQTLTIQAQNETGTTSTGGDLNLTSGTGTTAAGTLRLQVGGTNRIVVNATGVGFFAATPVAQQADIVAITDNTGGSVSNTFAAITAGASYAQADMTACKNALASTATKLNQIRTVLRNYGLMA